MNLPKDSLQDADGIGGKLALRPNGANHLLIPIAPPLIGIIAYLHGKALYLFIIYTTFNQPPST